MKRVAAIVLVILASVPHVYAQTKACDQTDTPLSCWLKFNPELPDDAKAAANKAKQDATKNAVAEANTGNTAVTSTTATALKDFLSVFAASVDSAAVSEKGNAVTFDWNLPFPSADQRFVKLQSVFTKPQISDSVSKALVNNADAVKQLNDGLSNTDDVAASLTYTPLNERYGRSITPHLPMYRALQSGIDVALKKEQDKARRRLEIAFPAADKGFSAIPEAERAAAIATFQAAAEAAQSTLQQTDALVMAFARLLNNQPQIYGSVIYHDRKDIVGPSTVSGKVTYEIGTRNLNAFRAENHDCEKATIAANAVTCLAKLKAFAKPGDVDSAPRLALSLEYQQSRAGRVDLSEFHVTDPVTSPHSHSLIGTATYGRSITAAAGRDGRIDVTASYQNVSNDPTKKDRFVGSVTYTQKITDTMSLPFSLIYANHSQFLSDVDRKLNVHFGISYKLPDLTKH